jgi:hypothetical protein
MSVEKWLNDTDSGNRSKKVKVQESRNRPGVAQRVLGDLGSQIFMTFGT